MNGISVIIAVYNTGKYLEECVNSILAQSYSTFEIVLVDDGSTDIDTIDILNKFSSFESIKVIHTNNRGVSNARNVGLKESSYDYITFVDSDDVVSQYYLYILFDNMIDTNADISICGVQKFYKNDSLNNIKSEENNLVVFCSDEAVVKLLSDDIKGYCCGKLFKRQIIRDLLFDVNIKVMEDFCFVNKAFRNSSKIVLSNMNLYFYRIHSLSATQSFNKNRLLSVNDAMKVILKINDSTFIKKSASNLINVETSMLYILASHGQLDKSTYKESSEIIKSIKTIANGNIRFSRKRFFFKYVFFKLGRTPFMLICRLVSKLIRQ